MNKRNTFMLESKATPFLNKYSMRCLYVTCQPFPSEAWVMALIFLHYINLMTHKFFGKMVLSVLLLRNCADHKGKRGRKHIAKFARLWQRRRRRVQEDRNSDVVLGRYDVERRSIPGGGDGDVSWRHSRSSVQPLSCAPRRLFDKLQLVHDRHCNIFHGLKKKTLFILK